MEWWTWLLISLGTFLAIYASFLAWLVSHGRNEDARALATFIPDCIVLVTRLARDSRVPRRRKLLLIALVAYLACHSTSSLTSSRWPDNSTMRSSLRSSS